MWAPPLTTAQPSCNGWSGRSDVNTFTICTTIGTTVQVNRMASLNHKIENERSEYESRVHRSAVHRPSIKQHVKWLFNINRNILAWCELALLQLDAVRLTAAESRRDSLSAHKINWLMVHYAICSTASAQFYGLVHGHLMNSLCAK